MMGRDTVRSRTRDTVPSPALRGRAAVRALPSTTKMITIRSAQVQQSTGLTRPRWLHGLSVRADAHSDSREQEEGQTRCRWQPHACPRICISRGNRSSRTLLAAPKGQQTHFPQPGEARGAEVRGGACSIPGGCSAGAGAGGASPPYLFEDVVPRDVLDVLLHD